MSNFHSFRVAVSQICGICMIYGPPITFAGHHVLKSCYLTTQIQLIPLSIHPLSSFDVFELLPLDIET